MTPKRIDLLSFVNNFKNRSLYLWRLGYLRSLLAMAGVALFPVLLTLDVWKQIWWGDRSFAWDGSGHFALASIYSETIFPDTFGWTHAYFGGMPFPNFYPPLFYWCVALLNHTGLFSLAASFKSVLALSVLLLPVAVWVLTWALTDRNRIVATASALACIPFLVDYRFRLVLLPSGLDYVSTFQAGLYTHPLGFILLAAWFVVYTRGYQKRWQIALASLLLALTVLANFFNAVVASVFILATLLTDITKLSSTTVDTRNERRIRLFAHTASPLIAVGLVLFWVVPIVTQYGYFVTRPLNASVFDYIPPVMWGWYALSVVGFVIWLRRPTAALMPYLLGCVILEGLILFSSEIAPGWFPLQPLRFLSTLNLLLAVPIGQVVVAATEALGWMFTKIMNLTRSFRPLPQLRGEAASVLRRVVTVGVFMILVFTAVVLIEKPYFGRLFSAGANQRIDPILDYAKHHRDGRYLVEHAMYMYPGSATDVRALTSYLGAQGNEAANVVFREASPNSLFFNPLIGALSTFPDSFGISSMLVDDIDFAEQPTARHLERALFMGVKYVVAASPRMKHVLSRELLVSSRHDFGTWSIFQLQDKVPARAQVPAYRPALVLSSLSFKQKGVINKLYQAC